MELRVGISGWTYAPWRGVFYPRGLPQREELAYAASKLNSIELNGSFYSLQRRESWEAWRAQTPERFAFSVKGPRFITHVKRLKDCRVPLANFFASGVLLLGDKLGPVLWQLPPSLRFDRDRLARFLDDLPRDTEEAARLSREHDFRLNGRDWTETEALRPVRHCVEVRHPSFEDPAFLDLLRDRRIACVLADTAGKWPVLDEDTADFRYARLHGDEELYASGYTPKALDAWAAQARRWLDAGRDAYLYFDNDAKVRAPYDAMSLARRLGIGPKPGAGRSASVR